MKQQRPKCAECGKEIIGAEYYISVPNQTKRVLLCEECYLEDK